MAFTIGQCFFPGALIPCSHMQIFFFCNVTVLPKVSFMTAEGNLRILAEIIER